MSLGRALDAILLAVLVWAAIGAQNGFVRSLLLFAAGLILIGWALAWRRRRQRSERDDDAAR
jgi:membrane protease YdiL (CAAX protease family)